MEEPAVVPGMEPTKHYWFALGKFLQDNGMRPVHVNPHHVKKSKELDDNNLNKNDRKDQNTITGLVNEGRFSLYLHTDRSPFGDQKPVKPAVSGQGRSYQDEEPDRQMVFHQLSGV